MTRGRNFRLVVILALGALAFVGTACSDSDSSGASSGASSGSRSGSPDEPKVYTQRDSEITVADEHAFIVALPVTSGTGYEWEAVTVPDLQQMTTEQVPARRPGGSTTQELTFRAQATGSGTQHTTLTLNYVRPWEDGVPPAKTVTFQVTITN